MKAKSTTDRPPPQDLQLRETLDANPSFLLLVDCDARILWANRAAADLLGEEPQLLQRKVCGEVLHCLHSQEPAGECGSSTNCKVCGIMSSVEAAAKGESVMRQELSMSLQTPQGLREARFLVTAAPFDFEGARSVLLTLEDVTELLQQRHSKLAS